MDDVNITINLIERSISKVRDLTKPVKESYNALSLMCDYPVLSRRVRH